MALSPINDNFSLNAPKPIRTTDIVGTGLQYTSKEDIPTSMRYEYMQTRYKDTGELWMLTGGTDDTDWVLVPVGGTGGVYNDAWIQPALDAKVDDNQVLTNVPAGAVFTDTVYDGSWIQPALDAKVDDSQVLTNVPSNAVFTDTVYDDSWIQPALDAKVNIFDDTVYVTADYYTTNQNTNTKKQLVFNSTGAPHTIVLDDTGLTVGFEQQVFNDSGQDITITSTETIKGNNVALGAGYFAYYRLIAANEWVLTVGGADGGGGGAVDSVNGYTGVVVLDYTNVGAAPISHNHNHGALTGLGDDDHTQYYNQTRGDARYAGLAANNNFTGTNRFNFPTLTIGDDNVPISWILFKYSGLGGTESTYIGYDQGKFIYVIEDTILLEYSTDYMISPQMTIAKIDAEVTGKSLVTKEWVLDKAVQTASEVPFTPTGNTSSTNVQNAIVELQSDINTLVAGGGGVVDSVNGEIGIVVLNYTDVGAAPTSHTHGNITSAGAIGATSGLIIKTGVSGVLNTLPAGTGTQYLKGDGTWDTPPQGTVTSVTGIAPIVSSGGITPAISITAATTSVSGSMSAADKTKLDGISTGANNYVLPVATDTVKGGIELFSNIDQSVVANTVSTTTGRTYGIQLNSADQAVVNVPWTDTLYSLPVATDTVRGGIELFSNIDQSVAANAISSTAGRTYGIQLNSADQAVVNVPWTEYTLPEATSTVKGGIELFSDTDQPVISNGVSATAGRTYGLQLNTDGQGVVNVPWTDTVYTLPEATSTVKGGIELFSDTDQSVAANTVSATAGRTYGIQLNAAGQGVVNVPWTDTIYTLPEATSTVKGGIELFSDVDQSVAANLVSTTAGRTYGLQLNAAGQGVVNVPWTDIVGGTDTQILYNNAGAQGGFGSVGVYDIDLGKPLVLETKSVHPNATSTGTIVYDDARNQPVYKCYNGAWMPFDGNTHVTLTYAASITYDWEDSGANATLTLTGNCSFTLSSVPDGATGTILIKQDATGSRTFTITNPTAIVIGSITSINSAANKYSTLTYQRFGSNYVLVYGRQL